MPEKAPDLPVFPYDAVGITSTIPIEVPLAAGLRVIDLNNVFVMSSDPGIFLRKAEAEGFPRNCCSWIRGIYGLIRTLEIRKVIFVTGGDCSNTQAMMEALVPFSEIFATFSYPYPPSPGALRQEMYRFCAGLGTTFSAAEGVSKSLHSVRRALGELDLLTWDGNRVTGKENHQWLVSSSDFGGDPVSFERRLKAFLDSARSRPVRPKGLRIGLVGVPPIITDLHEFVESLGAQVVYNEIPRQFSMPESCHDLVGGYLAYTYPYGAWPRLDDIRKQVDLRKLHGLIHYTQAFCHRQIHDMIFRHEIHVPILTLEGEIPGPCDPRTKLRIESFIEILKEKFG
ncbi:hypothetical protein AUK22_06210 [bacterium CG2_30_54_10]|nr:MAG: hypothetical protein AUK22_06210 [bacterium CG2_30_54_10]